MIERLHARLHRADADGDNAGRQRRDRGDTMLMTVILIGFLMIGSMALINASDAWGHRRELQSVADAAARAAAQITADEVRASASGNYTINRSRAQARASTVIPSGFSLGSVNVRGSEVTVTVYGTNTLPFPSGSFGGQSTSTADGGSRATSTAEAEFGVGE